MLPRAWRGGEQIGRAGEAGLRPHGQIGVRLPFHLGGALRRDAQRTPLATIDRDRVERRRDCHPGPELAQALRDRDADRPGVDAAVEMALADVDQPRGALQLRHRQHDAHRELPGGPLRAVQHRAVTCGEVEVDVGQRRQIAHRCRRGRAERGDLSVADGGVRCRGQGREGAAIETDHRHASAEQGVRDERAQRQDGLVLAEHDGGRRRPVHDEFEQHGASRAGSAAARNGEDPAGDALAVQRMLAVHDHSRLRCNPAPEAQAEACVQHGPRGVAGDQRLAAETGVCHACSDPAAVVARPGAPCWPSSGTIPAPVAGSSCRRNSTKALTRIGW